MTDEQAERTEDGRTKILRAALGLIAEHGVGGLTNRRIAAAASVSLGSLTYHFPSQQDLLRDCLALHAEEEARRLEAIAAELRAKRPDLAELARRVRAVAADSANRPELLAELELHLQAARDSAVQPMSKACFEAYEHLATAALAAFGVPDPQRHAPSVVGLLVGLGVKQLATGSRDAAGVVEGLSTIVLGARAEARAKATAGPDGGPR